MSRGLGDVYKRQIEVVSPGTYEVSFSISAPDAGGIFFAQLSGQNLGVIDVPATGGWYNWEDLPAQTISVSEGEKFLKIQIVQAGFNIQSVNFNQVLSIDNSFLNPDDFVLGKPYPNPFNPSVKLNLARFNFTDGLKGFGYGFPNTKSSGFRNELSILKTWLKLTLCILNPACTICIFKNFSPSETLIVWAGRSSQLYQPPVAGTSITPRFCPLSCAKKIPPASGAEILNDTS